MGSSSKSTRGANAIPADPGVVTRPEAEPKWVLLHGTPLTPRVWDEVGAILAMSRPVVAPALPRPGTQAEIAGRVLASLEDTRAPLHVVGHSFGGQVAIEVALAAPLRLASLTILCSRATPFPAFAASAESLRRGDPLDLPGSLARWFLPDELAADGPIVRLRAPASRAQTGPCGPTIFRPSPVMTDRGPRAHRGADQGDRG